MPSERSITKVLIKALNSMPFTKAIKLHGSAFTEAGTPDILCVCFGLAFMIEVKKEGGVLSKLQEVRLMQWKNAMANCIVAYSANEALLYILAQLKEAQRKLLKTLRSGEDVSRLDSAVWKALKHFDY